MVTGGPSAAAPAGTRPRTGPAIPETRSSTDAGTAGPTAPADTSEEDLRGSGDALTHAQLRGSSLLLAGRGLSTALKFAAELIVVRYLATEAYGALTYALAAVVFLRGMAALGLHRAITRFVPVHLERGEEHKVMGVVALVLVSILIAGASVVAVFHLAPGHVATLAGVSDEQPLEILFLLVFLVPVEALDDFLTGLCAVFTDSRTIFVRRYVLNPGLRLAAAVLLVTIGADVTFLAYGYLFAGVAGVGYYAWSVYGQLRRRGLFESRVLKGVRLPARRVFSYVGPVMAADWCAILMSTTGPLLLGYFTDMRQVALFQVVVPLVTLNKLVAQSFGVLFEPSAARLLGRDDAVGLDRLYWRSASWVAVLSFPAFAVSFTAAEPLTALLFGDRYAEAAPILSILALGVFLDVTLGFNGPTLRVAGQERTLLAVNASAALLCLLLNLALIPRAGALGAAIATGISWVAYAIAKQVALWARTGVRGFDPAMAGTYSAIALAAAALVAARLGWHSHGWVVGAAAVASTVAVLARARATLSITETFPEVARFPAVGRLLG